MTMLKPSCKLFLYRLWYNPLVEQRQSYPCLPRESSARECLLHEVFSQARKTNACRCRTVARYKDAVGRVAMDSQQEDVQWIL